MMKKNELGHKKVTLKLRGCMSALALAIIHNFKCRNLDFSNVSKPFITYWQEEKDLSSVVKQFEIHMDFILPVKREKQKLQFKVPSVSATSRKSASPIIKVVEGPSPSTRQLVMDLPHTLMTDEEIDALDVPVIFIHLIEVFNPEFLNQIDDICKRHLEAKDSANKVDPTIALLVKRTVDLEFERNEDVPDLDYGVHGGEEKGGNDEKEPKEDDKKTGNADDDAGLQGDEEKGGNKDLDAGVHADGEKGGNVEKEQPKEDDTKTRNADDDQLKGAKDKDKGKSSTHIPTRTAGVELVDLCTPTSPPVVEVVENVYSRKSWRVDSSAKRKKIPDLGGPSFQLLTLSPLVEDVGFADSAESGEGVGSLIPMITSVNVKYPRVQLDSEIAENEIILKKLEGTSEYDDKLKEWEEKKKKLVTKDDDLFFNKCKEAISSWVKSFPRNDIREAELIFVPLHKDDHYTVLVLNKKAKKIKNIDNRTDMKDIDRYIHEGFNGLTYFCRAFDAFMEGNMRCRDFDNLQHWGTATLYFPWRSKDNNYDCDVEKKPKEDDKKTRNDQLKEAKDKDKDKSSTSIPTPTAHVELVNLSTPTPPPVVEAVENIYSRKSWRVDSSAKRKKIPDFSRPSFQLLTPSPVVEDVGFADSADSGEGVGSSIPIITPVKVKYPRGDGSYSSLDQSSYKSYIPQKHSKSEIPSTPELLNGWDYDHTSEKSEKLLRVEEKGDYSEDDTLNNLIDRIAKQGVDSEEDEKEEDEKKDIGNVVGVASSSAPGLQAIPVNNHGLILCRSLQQYNKYLSDLSPENVLLVDYLFYNEFDDVSLLSLDPEYEATKTNNFIMQSDLQSDLIVDFENQYNNYSVQLYKFDFVSMPRHDWLTSAVIDGCACMFNRQEEESPSATRRFWFNLMPFKVKKVKSDSEIAENEIILKKLEGTSQYDEKLKEWEEKKKMLGTKDDDLFFNKCKEAISSWVKSFPRNDIQQAELIFVHVHKDDHYTVLVLNKKAKRIEDIDNRTDMKDIDRYIHEGFDGLTYFCRAFDAFMQSNMRCRDFDHLQHWEKVTLFFPLEKQAQQS
ncbi:hypothetical protein BVRB_5g108600 [Beta vulgaris subsp. vulgaris]|nr:hypothetical protein BVRB_5g108600 [Beta vulgaris subsp. vulgaris]